MPCIRFFAAALRHAGDSMPRLRYSFRVRASNPVFMVGHIRPNDHGDNKMKKVLKLVAGISFSVAATAAFPSYAQAVCEPLTPAAIGAIDAALDQALAAADDAAIAAGYGWMLDSSSLFPNWEIRQAKAKWRETYLNYFPANAYVPYITPTNVALALNGTPNIEIMAQLVHGRWWATALAYHYQITDTPLAAKYLITRRAIQNAINKTEQLGTDGARCGILSYTPQLTPLLP
jgi:hypothetical protein